MDYNKERDKYDKARLDLRYALKNQKTITIKKLSGILQAMNVSLKKDPDTKEIEYLKGEIRKLVKENKKLRRNSRRRS